MATAQEQQEQKPAKPADSNPYAGRPRNLETFTEALGRAFGRAMETGIFRKNPYTRNFRDNIVAPITGIAADIKEFRNREKQDPKAAAELVGNNILREVTPERMADLERNATVSWWLGIVLTVAGLGFFGFAVLHGLNTMGRYNACLSGLCLFAFGASRTLRSARDIEVMRQRLPLTFERFLDRLSDLWCPYPDDSWQRYLVAWFVLPASALAFFAYPAVVQITRILGLA